MSDTPRRKTFIRCGSTAILGAKQITPTSYSDTPYTKGQYPGGGGCASIDAAVPRKADAGSRRVDR